VIPGVEDRVGGAQPPQALFREYARAARKVRVTDDRHLHMPPSRQRPNISRAQRTQGCSPLLQPSGRSVLEEGTERGIVDHHILTIHHVREGSNQTGWDLAFLAFGALLWTLVRPDSARSVSADTAAPG